MPSRKHLSIFTYLLKMGFFFSRITERVLRLRRDIEGSLLPFYNLFEDHSTTSVKQSALLELKSFEKRILSNVDEINEMVKIGNKYLKSTVWEGKIPVINKKKLKSIFKSRFSEIYKEKKLQELGNKNLKLNLEKLLEDTFMFNQKFMKDMEEHYYFAGYDKLTGEYKKGVNEAIDLYSIGRTNTSVFIIGRTIESLLDDMIIHCIKNHKYSRVELSELSYESKIGKLKGEGIINEKLFHELSSIKFDRNTTGHPFKKIFKLEENRTVISKSIEVILDLQKKVKI